MSSTKFGTSAIGGLNAEVAPHLLQDHELQKSVNGSTEQVGTWSPAKEAIPQYTGSAISSGCVGRMDGADHLVWLDGNVLYDNDVNVGSVATGGGVADTKIMPVGGGFLILGSATNKAYFYDSNHLRYLGAWQGDLEEDNTHSSASKLNTVAAVAIPGGATITSTDLGTTFDLDATAHGLIAGDRFYITGMTGLDDLDDRSHTVASVTDEYIFVIDAGSSGYTAWSTGGNIYKDACGVSGDYTYYYTCFIETADGSVLESDLYQLWSISRLELEISRDPRPDTPPEPIALTELWRIGVNLYGKWLNEDQDSIFFISGTEGTDYKPGIRLYRTKSDGADAYLVKEFGHDDTASNGVAIGIATITEGGTTTFNTGSNHDLSDGDRVLISGLNGLDEMNDRTFYVSVSDADTFVINEDSSGYVAYDDDGSGTVTKCILQYETIDGETYFSVSDYYDTTHDMELGAPYTYDIGARRNPPNARQAALLGTRLLLNDKDNTDRLWYSNVGGINYFGYQDYIVMPDTITGLGVVRNAAAVIMPSGIDHVSFSYGLPDRRTIDGEVGGVYGDAICSTRSGVLFGRDDGAYLFDGITTDKISNKGYLDGALGTPEAIVESGDMLLLHGSDASYTARKIGGEYVWHEVDLDEYNFISADSSGNLYGFCTTQIDKLFSGSRTNGRMRTKSFGSYETYSPVRIMVDIEGSGTVFARVVGNLKEQPLRVDCSGTGTGRRVVWKSVPRPKGEYFYIEAETTGDVKIHGIWMEVER